MLYFSSIVLALVQALTEFLPISSSAHLIIFHQIFTAPELDTLTFDVMLHLGTFLAILFYFWPEVVKLVKGFFSWKELGEKQVYRRLSRLIIVSAVPAALIGYVWGNWIEEIFRPITWVIWPMIGGAILLILVEKFSKKNQTVDGLTFSKALYIGLAQVLAFMPGTSRSGITITAGMQLGLARHEAARFSFLMSLPIVFGAVLQKITKINFGDFSSNLFLVFIVGVVVSTAAGYLVIKYLLKFLASHSLNYFAVYRFILAALLLIFFVFK